MREWTGMHKREKEKFRTLWDSILSISSVVSNCPRCELGTKPNEYNLSQVSQVAVLY